MRNRGAQRGMTLIEILIALIVMVLGVLGILALFPPSLEMAKESMEETNAEHLSSSSNLREGGKPGSGTLWNHRLSKVVDSSASSPRASSCSSGPRLRSNRR